MSKDLYVFGCRGSYPVYGPEFVKYGQDTSCYVIKDNDYALVLDCGSGYSSAVNLLSSCKRVDIILSHIHYDHIIGLLENPETLQGIDLHFYGDFENWFEIESEKNVNPCLYKIEDYVQGSIHSIQVGNKYVLGNGTNVTFIRSNHGENACMADIHLNGCHIFYTGDYEHNANTRLDSYLSDCDVLIFDGSYSDEDYKKCIGWGHSKWSDGCRIAKNCYVKKLVITHHDPKYTDSMLEKQEKASQNIYEKTVFAKQGDIYSLGN